MSDDHNMNCSANDLVYRLRKRAEIRRQIDTRKSVQNNEPDRIADLLEESSNRIEELEQVLQSIANEQVELSNDKIRWQIQDHIRWATGVLNNDIPEQCVAKKEKLNHVES